MTTRGYYRPEFITCCENWSVGDMACGPRHMLASKAPPVLVSLLSVIHESIKEFVGILLLELLTLGLQSLDGLLVFLLTFAQILLGELQEALAVDGPAQWHVLQSYAHHMSNRD